MLRSYFFCHASQKLGWNLNLFLVIVILPMETYFELVWSRFSTNDEGIWVFSTLLTISCKNVSYASFFAPAGILTFPVVPAHLTKPTRWNRGSSTGLKLYMTEFLFWVSFSLGTSNCYGNCCVYYSAIRSDVWIILSSPPRSNDLPLFLLW